ncbi:hypothetical protein B7486_57195, partial [cyanobacterium TDX16]
MRRVALGAAVVLGLLAGALAAVVWQDRGDDSAAATRSGGAADGSTTVVPLEPPVVPSTEVTVPGPEVLLAWTAGGLPPGFGAAVDHLEATDEVTVVQGGTLDLARSWDASGLVVDDVGPGLALPLDAIAIDPATYPGVVSEGDQQAFRGLLPGEALLGSSSAALRGLGEGSRIELLDGTSLRVAGVVDDAAVGAAEVVVRAGRGATESMGLGIARERYVLFTVVSDSRVAVERAVRSLAPGVPMRVRAPGETPFLRSSDAVLPQVLIKEVFGEFAYAPPGAGQRAFDQDPDWAGELVAEDVPLL